jgi:GNAT superfamily N-acetyltransferase
LPQETIVRRFNEADLASVYELVRSTIDISYRPDYPQNAIEFFQGRHTRERILDDAKNGRTLVAWHSGEIAGTGTLLGAHIRRVFVDPRYQRRGIGKLIADKLEQMARADNVIELDLSAALGSRTFWESRGFTVREELFAPAREDLVIHYFVMVKKLDGGGT